MRKTLLLASLLLSFIQLFAHENFVPPTTPASSVFFNLMEGGAFRINWTSGNGARRLVVMRAGAPVTGTPVNGVDYSASASFGSGDILNTGEFIVYDNTSSFVDVSNLQPNTTYHIAIFEYNGTASTTEYLITGAPVANQATLSAPTVQASGVNFTNVNGNSVTVNWVNGNGTRRIALMRAGGAVNTNPVNLTSYPGNTIFAGGTPVFVDNYVVFSGTAATVNVTSLQPNTTYHVAIFEMNGTSTPVYLTSGAATGSFTTPARPTVPASALFFNLVDGGSLRVNWTIGNGTRRIVIARAGSAPDAVPADGTDYAANADWNLAPEIAAGQKIVYDNTNSFVDITNLTPGTTYHFRVYEYSGTGASIGYLTASFGSGSQAILSAPTNGPSGLNFTNIGPNAITLNWTNGNGNRRMVFAKANSAVDFDPVDGVTYGPSTSFGSGAQLGTGNYCVFNQTSGTTVTITNLTPGVTYHFAVFEANGNSTPVFLRPPAITSQATGTRPTVPSSATFFNLVDGGDMRLNWTIGNGSRRIVIARAGSDPDVLPVDGVDYTVNSNWNLAPEIAPGQKIIYDNTSSFVDISGLTPSTTYHFRVYEYSGTGATIQYLTSSFASASQATVSPPSTQASNITFPVVGSNSMTISWTNGNGTGRIVLVKAASAVDAVPIGGTVYTASSAFGGGTQIGTGNFTVFRQNNGNSVNVTGLTPGITYHVAVFDYNGNSTGAYNTTNPAIASTTTSGAPTVPPSAEFFNLIEGNSLRLNWTNGNGLRRIVVAREAQAVDAIPANGTDYASNADFGVAPEISTGQRVVYDNISGFADINGLQPNTIYHFRIYEYTGTGAAAQYLTTSFGSGSQATLSAPSIQVSNITFTGITGNAFTINWTNGNGTGRVVLVKQGSAVNAIPQNFVTYSPGSIFGSGSQIGTGNYVVYRSNASSITVTGLLSGTTYHVAIFEYNGSSGSVYNQTVTAFNQATTLGAPQVPANTLAAANVQPRSLQLNWNNGSGQRRLVLMREGAAVNAAPVDNVAYTANSFFGSGSQIGSGNYVVFDGTDDNITITNLQPTTEYHFAVFELNAFGASVLYLAANAPTGNATTISALPVIFEDFEGAAKSNSIELNWTTAQEQNSSHFDVQKSTDGNQFASIGTVQAAGNSDLPRQYRFTDNNPFDGNAYYRLRQVDKDATFIFSKTISIRYQSTTAIRKIVNPVHERIYIQFSQAAVPAGTNWKLYDMHGRIMLSRRITGNTIDEPVPGLQPGIYVMEIVINGKKQSIRLLKTNQQ